MSALLVLLAVAVVIAQPAGPNDDPRAIVRDGLRAVEVDCVTTLRAR